MDALALLQMLLTLGAIAGTIVGAEMIVRKTPSGQRWPATALVAAMLTALIFLPVAIGVATSTGHAPPPTVTRFLVIGPLTIVMIAGFALRMRYARK